jgi:hypothetical protein
MISVVRECDMNTKIVNPDPTHNAEIIKRAYSMASNWVPDFNGDGVVNPTDLTEFNIALGESYSRKTYLFGNVFQDPQGVRNQADIDYFLIAYAAELGKIRAAADPAYVVNYGGPDDM